MANPPFNLKDWGGDKLVDDPRWDYGVPPEGNANFAWLQHMIHHLSSKGKMAVVLANGALSSQQSGEGEIRQRIIEADLVDGIVALPTQLFYSTQIPVSLWFISKNKQQPGKTLFVDARNLGTMVSRKLRELFDNDIERLAQTFENFHDGTLENQAGFCYVATTDEIREQDFILTPGRYVGIKEANNIDEEPFEERMSKLRTELEELFEKSERLQKQIVNNLNTLLD